MNCIQKLFGHLSTINKHRHLVMKLCFSCGMYSQGLKHDLSKYSPAEFISSVKYYQGNRSPITKEKEVNGYSLAWLHHKGRNKHHWEYWVDMKYKTGSLTVIAMPFNYMLESVLDKIAASKVYKKDAYTQDYPYNFFYNSKEFLVMNKETARQILTLLEYLKDNGEEKALTYYRYLFKEYKKDKNFTI